MAAVGQYQQTLFVSPANGTSPIDADEVRSNDEALRAKHNSHDNDETIHLQSSVAASRPAAGVAGRVWLSTDALTLAYDNGVSWAGLAYAASTHAHAWGDITSGKPTTLAGYGITDGVNVVNPTTSGTGTHTGGKVTFAATAAGYASVNLPHGTAPSSPANGDLWTTTAGLFARINGATGQAPLLNSASALTLASQMRARVRGTTTSITNDTMQAVTWGVEDVDVGACVNLGGSASRITVPSGGAGLWVVGGLVQANGTLGSGSGQRWRFAVYKNGAAAYSDYPYTVAPSTSGGDGDLVEVPAVIVEVADGDYLELFVSQNKGSAHALLDGYFYAHKVA